MLDSNKLQQNYVEIAVSWGEAIKTGDHQAANRLNKVLMKIFKELKKDATLAEMVLAPLLSHLNPSVRLSASVDALNVGIHVKEAETVLISLASDSKIHVMQTMAQINLSEWNKKKDTNRKDEPAA